MEQETDKNAYQAMTDDDLKKLSPGPSCGVVTAIFPNPENPEEDITANFTVYDGIAYGTVEVDGKTREVVASFPLAKFVNDVAKNMQKKVLENLGIEEKRNVTPIELLQSYGTCTFIGD